MVILFFDGECGLCNRAVLHFLSWEREGSEVQFAPLQGETAQKLLTAQQSTVPYHSLLVWDGREVHEKASALRALTKDLRTPWGNFSHLILKALPTSWTNVCYDVVARNRHRVSQFSCATRVDPAIKNRFLP